MSSIPLPAMHINPVQIPDMIGDYERVLRIKQAIANAPLQQQALQQQVQQGQQTLEAGALDNETKRRALADQKAMDAAMRQWTQPQQGASSAAPAPGVPATQGTQAPPASSSSMPNYDDLIDLARTNGVSFGTIQTLQQHVLDMKDKASTIAKNDAETGASNANATKTKNGMLIDAMTGVANLPDDQLVPGLLYTAQNLARQGLLDPPHVQMAQQLAQTGDPTAIRKSLSMQIAGMGGFNKMLEDAQKREQVKQEQGKSDPNSPFYAPSQASVDMGTAPGAAQIQAGKTRQAGQTAGAEAAARQPYELALAKQRQALSQGDPEAAAQLMVNGDATLAELKSRGATPDFIARTLQAARRLSNGQYNAQAADAQFDVAKSPANVAFFGSAKSLTDKGGTLDQLAESAKNIPQHQFPVLNSLDDWQKEAAGTGPLANYAAIVLGVADDYAKVMGGGVGSDSSRLQAANLISKKLSQEGRDGAIAGIRGSVNSQINGRIGRNPVLGRMYGNQQAPANTSGGNNANGGNSAPPAGYVRIQASDGSLHDLPQSNLGRARQRDPGLKVVNQ